MSFDLFKSSSSLFFKNLVLKSPDLDPFESYFRTKFRFFLRSLLITIGAFHLGFVLD